MDLIGNPNLIQSGIILGVLASVGYYLKDIVLSAIRYTKKYFVTELTLDNRTDAYTWIINWFDTQFKNQRFSPIFISSTRQSEDDEVPSVLATTNNNIPSKMYISPGYGTHILKYKGKRFILTRLKNEKLSTGSKHVLEEISIKIIGRNPKPIIDLINESYKSYMERDADSISIYFNSYGGWSKLKTISKRNINSIILKSGIKEHLFEDFERFFAAKSWYEKKQIVFKRGYLFSGIPGSGKTSLIHCIASYYNLNICILDLKQSDLDNQDLISLMSKLPERSLVLIEDINTAFYQSTGERDDKNGVTLSGFLNTLDGMCSPHEVLFFITTNNKQDLDKSLLRPGRFDYHLDMDYCDIDQATRITDYFYSTNNKVLIDLIENIIKDGAKLSPARLHGYYMNCGNNIQIAIDNIKYLTEDLS